MKLLRTRVDGSGDSEGPIWETFRLYNLTADPTESNDLAAVLPDLVQDLRSRLEVYDATRIPANTKPEVAEGNPNLYGGVWTPGWCESYP